MWETQHTVIFPKGISTKTKISAKSKFLHLAKRHDVIKSELTDVTLLLL